MKITRLELAGSATRPKLHLDRLGVGLNVVTGPTGTGKSALADCIAHLLYGRRGSPVRQPAGLMDVETRLGNFRLRREPQPSGPCRLTIAGLGSEVAAPETLSQVLRGCSPQFLSGLYCLDGTQAPTIDWLLSEYVAAEVTRLLSRRDDATSVDPARQEELLVRRDELAEQVAQLLAERRRTSESIARHLRELVRQRADLITAIERIREELHAVEVELTSASTHTRYRELELVADQTSRATERSEGAKRLDEVDEQIERWRSTLHDLEHRESQIRAELARERPTDSAASLPLADQRAALAVAERLVQDLHSEIARFARSVTSNACVCRDAHPRLQPLVALLQQQVSRLVTLTDEHERSVRWQELQTEVRQLARSQAELRDQLEHLQLQREALSRRERPRRWRSADKFAGTASFSHSTADTRDLEQNRYALAAKLEELELQLGDLNREHQRAVGERTAVLSDRLLEQKQAELAEVQRRLQLGGAELRTLTLPDRHESQRAIEPSHHVRHGGFRSSDYLAQLTDGQFIELKLSSGGRSAFVVDHHARTHAVNSLSKAEQHLVATSLRLAIIVSLAEAGFRLPVVLDEPFAHLNDRQAAILAGVFRDFTGQQMFVFTDRQAALEQFRSWGAAIHDLRNLERPIAGPTTPPRLASPQELSHRVETHSRSQSPKLRVERGQPAKRKRSKSRSDRRVSELPKSKRPRPTKPLQPKFYLELQSPIASAPSIMPEVATELAAVGIRQVRDLLAADSSKLAERLSDSEINPVDVVAWQHQARLCCRIPNLRPRDAAILVGSGFSTPEEVASMDPAELLGFIQSFAQMNTGRELMGDGGPPELATIESWTRAARHSRVLGAA